MAYIRTYKSGFRAEVERNGQYKSATFKTKREAQDWARHTEIELLAKKKGGGYTFGQAVEKYKQEVSINKRGREWEDRRLTAMEAHFGAATLLDEIGVPQVAEWRDSRLRGDPVRGARPVTGSTVVRESNLLKHLFKVAKEEWLWTEADPFRGVRMPKENQPRHQVWRWQQIKRVLRAQGGPKTTEVIAAFHIALRTGMRLSEVLIAPQCLDAKRKVVCLPRSKTTGYDEVPVGRIAVGLLKRKPFVVDANEASTLFAKLCSQLLIEDLTFHDTRGTALTLLAKKVNPLKLARISRHRDIRVLQRTYYRETSEEIARDL